MPTFKTQPAFFAHVKPGNMMLTLLGCVLLLFVAAQLFSLFLIQLSGLPTADIFTPDLSNPKAGDIRVLLLVMQGLTSTLMFVGSSWITLAWTANAYIAELNTRPTFRIKNAAWVTLLCMISLPAIGYLSELNRLIDFGWLGTELNQYITENEAKLGTLTHFLVSVTGIGQGLLLVLVVAVIAAVSEELFFRGLIQNLLLRSSNNPHLAIWVTAFIFGFIHMQFLSMLPRVLLGALFGYVYYWSGNLYLAIAGHFINNFVTAIGMIALVEAKLPDTTLDSAPWWAGLLSALGLAFGSYLFRRQLFESFADAD